MILKKISIPTCTANSRNMLKETVDKGIVKWTVIYEGIRGGTILLYIVKNRTSFIKKFVLKDNDSFKEAIKVCKEKVYQILHLKDSMNTDLARIANYCIDSTSVEEMTTEERDKYRSQMAGKGWEDEIVYQFAGG